MASLQRRKNLLVSQIAKISFNSSFKVDRRMDTLILLANSELASCCNEDDYYPLLRERHLP
jgi:hypothetical protein